MDKFANKKKKTTDDISYELLSAPRTSFDSREDEMGDDKSFESNMGKQNAWKPLRPKYAISKFEATLIVAHIALFIASLTLFLASRNPSAKFWGFADPDPLYCKT